MATAVVAFRCGVLPRLDAILPAQRPFEFRKTAKPLRTARGLNLYRSIVEDFCLATGHAGLSNHDLLRGLIRFL
jgi:hypothetical protein